MTNFKDIQALLDRYWEGETTLEEERTLRAYFNSNEVDSRLTQEISFFKALVREQTIQMQAQIPMPLQVKHKNLNLWRTAAAAVLVLGLVAWWLQQPAAPSTAPTVADTAPAVNTPQPALIPNNPVPTATESNPVANLDEPAAKPKVKQVRHRKNTNINTAPPTPREPIALTPEEEKAFAEVKAALALLSSKLSRGRKEAIKGAGHLDAFEKVPKAKLNS